MEDFELVGPNGTDVNNEFLKQYRDALRNQYDASVSSLKQQNRNNQASIMSAANEKGMMYSNFPQRSKIQAETDYLKNMSKLHSTYQTGLDKLRSNAVNTYNQIKAYEEAIADLDELSGGTGGTPGTNPTTDTSGDDNKNGDFVGSGSLIKGELQGVWQPTGIAGRLYGLGAWALGDSDPFTGKVTGTVGESSKTSYQAPTNIGSSPYMAGGAASPGAAVWNLLHNS